MPLVGWRGCHPEWGAGWWHRRACAWLRASAQQEPDGVSGLVSLLYGLLLSGLILKYTNVLLLHL
jgi:hypothetical protein